LKKGMEHTSVSRAALLVATGALLEAVVGPYLTVGPFSPKLTLICVVFAVSALGDLHAVLLGFFGGILFDALGGGLFGVGALGGLLAAALSVRAGSVRRKGTERFILAQVVAVAVAGYALIRLTATGLAGLSGPPFGEYLLVGVLPDALLNGLLAYFVGGLLLRFVRHRARGWEGR
jgi:rod shape-determining protein MreD